MLSRFDYNPRVAGEDEEEAEPEDGSNEDKRCRLRNCRLPVSSLVQCSAQGCTCFMHPTCFQHVYLVGRSLAPLLEGTVACCQKHYTKVRAMQNGKLSWKNDGASGVNDPNSSEQILLHWLLTPGNYENYCNKNNKGVSKKKYAERIVNIINEKNVKVKRDVKQVVSKISHMEDQFKRAFDLECSPDGRDPDSINEEIHKICPHYSELKQIMSDRVETFPSRKRNAESSPPNDSSVQNNEEEEDEGEEEEEENKRKQQRLSIENTTKQPPEKSATENNLPTAHSNPAPSEIPLGLQNNSQNSSENSINDTSNPVQKNSLTPSQSTVATTAASVTNASFSDEITKLRKENADLKAKVAAHEAASSSDEISKLRKENADLKAQVLLTCNQLHEKDKEILKLIKERSDIMQSYVADLRFKDMDMRNKDAQLMEASKAQTEIVKQYSSLVTQLNKKSDNA